MVILPTYKGQSAWALDTCPGPPGAGQQKIRSLPGWIWPDSLSSPLFCLPSFHSSGSLSLSLPCSYHLLSHLQSSQLQLLSIQVYPSVFSVPKYRTNLLKLLTLHHPVHTSISPCLQTPPPPPAQALFASQCTSGWDQDPLGRRQWQPASLVCFHVTAKHAMLSSG